MLYHDLAARPICKAHAIGHFCMTHTSHPVDQFTRYFQSDMVDGDGCWSKSVHVASHTGCGMKAVEH